MRLLDYPTSCDRQIDVRVIRKSRVAKGSRTSSNIVKWKAKTEIDEDITQVSMNATDNGRFGQTDTTQNAINH